MRDDNLSLNHSLDTEPIAPYQALPYTGLDIHYRSDVQPVLPDPGGDDGDDTDAEVTSPPLSRKTAPTGAFL